MRQEWTQEETQKLIGILTDPNHNKTTEQIGELMGRTKQSIRRKATRLGYTQIGRGGHPQYPEDFPETVFSLRERGLTQKQIAEQLHVQKHVISSLIRSRNKCQEIAYWTPEEDQWIRTHYGDRSIDLSKGLVGRSVSAIRHRAQHLGVNRPQGRPKGSPGRKRLFDEAEVCRRYNELGTLGAVADSYNSCAAVISKVLRRNGITPTCGVPSKLDSQREALIADYKSGKLPMIELAIRYGLSDDAIRGQLKKWRVYDPKHKEAFCNRRSPYQCWVDSYGQEEADRRRSIYNAKASKRNSGKGNLMYGKPSPQGAGNGWKGWYRGQYFRSLREASFMIAMDKTGTPWQSAETMKIPYTLDGVPRTYRPDYIVGNKVIEIKPKKLHNTPTIVAKHTAATLYCQERGLAYELMDMAIDPLVIHQAWEEGSVRFDRDYEQRFLAYVQAHKG